MEKAVQKRVVPVSDGSCVGIRKLTRKLRNCGSIPGKLERQGFPFRVSRESMGREMQCHLRTRKFLLSQEDQVKG